jgi:RNA polymerase sigma factor (sigma-70 family)
VKSIEAGFDEYARDAEPKLRRALVARYGADIGSEATSDALTYGWRHWERVQPMENPTGYLYRVGRNRARRLLARRRPVLFRDLVPEREPWVEPALPGALRALSPKQRQAVVLIHAYEWTQVEVAALLGVRPTTVQNHLERGLAKLRAALEVNEDA